MEFKDGAVTLYSTGCPKCNVLKQKLDEKGIQYEVSSDTDKMMELGFMAAPVLQVGEEYMDFSKAIQWLRTEAEATSCDSCSF